MQRAARKVLLTSGAGFVHVMKPDETLDPGYVVSRSGLASGLPNINVELPEITNFHAWSKFLLSERDGGESKLYSVPGPKNCLRGPHAFQGNQEAWKISNCHHINIGIGEDAKGDLVAHHGVWFARDSFAQAEPDEVVVRQENVMAENEWNKMRELVRGDCPVQKQQEPIAIAYLKQKDLYELGKLMGLTETDFRLRYPDPDEGKSNRTKEQIDSILSTINSIFQKNEEKWTSGDYYDLLRWKMIKGYSVYTTKKARKEKWIQIVTGFSDSENEEVTQLRAVGTTLATNIDTDLGGTYEVQDIPYWDIELRRGQLEQQEFVKDYIAENALALATKTQAEMKSIAFGKWCESLDEEDSIGVG